MQYSRPCVVVVVVVCVYKHMKKTVDVGKVMQEELGLNNEAPVRIHANSHSVRK